MGSFKSILHNDIPTPPVKIGAMSCVVQQLSILMSTGGLYYHVFSLPKSTLSRSIVSNNLIFHSL